MPHLVRLIDDKIGTVRVLDGISGQVPAPVFAAHQELAGVQITSRSYQVRPNARMEVPTVLINAKYPAFPQATPDRDLNVRFSLGARLTTLVKESVASIPERKWQAIEYSGGQAQVAEEYLQAPGSCRLIVRVPPTEPPTPHVNPKYKNTEG